MFRPTQTKLLYLSDYSYKREYLRKKEKKEEKKRIEVLN